MTTYANVNSAWLAYMEGDPANEPGAQSPQILEVMSVGRPRTQVYPDTPYIEFEAYTSGTDIGVGDEETIPMSTQAKANVGMAKFKTFTWNIEMTKLQMAGFTAGNPSARDAMNEKIIAANAALAQKIDYWILDGPASTDTARDTFWVPPFKESSGNTVSNPDCMSTAAGTVTDSSTVNVAGTGATAWPLDATVGADITKMLTLTDSVTNARVAKPNGGNSWTLLVNDAAWQYMRPKKQLMATGVFSDTTVEQDLAAASVTAKTVPASVYSWDGAINSTSEYRLLMNPQQNFHYYIAPTADGTQGLSMQDWRVVTGPTGEYWRLLATMRIAVWSRPLTIDGGTTWYKAVAARNITPNGS